MWRLYWVTDALFGRRAVVIWGGISTTPPTSPLNLEG